MTWLRRKLQRRWWSLCVVPRSEPEHMVGAFNKLILLMSTTSVVFTCLNENDTWLLNNRELLLAWGSCLHNKQSILSLSSVLREQIKKMDTGYIDRKDSLSTNQIQILNIPPTLTTISSPSGPPISLLSLYNIYNVSYKSVED